MNSDRLLDGLKSYRTVLDRHLGILQADFQQLELRSRALQSVYEGEAAEQFQAAWWRTVRWFQDYQDYTNKLKSILNERITALEAANQPSGGIM
jgi:uncharacterized protein YukE